MTASVKNRSCSVVGPDGESVRVFRARTADTRLKFYRTYDDKAKVPLEKAASAPLMMDDATGSNWDFRGCAIDGSAKGTCLEQIDALTDYWFDWREYNPKTTVYRH